MFLIIHLLNFGGKFKERSGEKLLTNGLVKKLHPMLNLGNLHEILENF